MCAEEGSRLTAWHFSGVALAMRRREETVGSGKRKEAEVEEYSSGDGLRDGRIRGMNKGVGEKGVVVRTWNRWLAALGEGEGALRQPVRTQCDKSQNWTLTLTCN
jgi:hypothetical protein